MLIICNNKREYSCDCARGGRGARGGVGGAAGHVGRGGARRACVAHPRAGRLTAAQHRSLCIHVRTSYIFFTFLVPKYYYKYNM